MRRVNLKSGIIDTYAGTGEPKPTPDGAPVAGVPLNGPRAIDLDPQGNLYLVLREGNAVYKIDAKSQTIQHLAGTGEKGYTGDGGDARKAKLFGPKGIAWAPDKSVYIDDAESHTVRRIDLKSGVVTTAVGTPSLASLLREHLARGADDARALPRQIFQTEADLTPDLAANTLTVRLHHLTQAAHDQAIELLLADLNATQTVFPGTSLTLVFKVGSS